MKYSTLLVGATQAAPSTSELIVEGILKGALDYTMPAVGDCIKDADLIVADAKTAMADFEAGGIVNIVAAIQEVGKLVNDAKSSLADCQGIEADWETLEKEMAPFMDPTDFVYHVETDIVLNETNIIMGVRLAQNSYAAGDFFYFGEYVGEMLMEVFVGTPTNKMNKQILAGFLSKFNLGIDITALLFCIEEIDQGLIAFDEAVQIEEQAWADKSIMEALSGGIAIAAGVQTIEQGLPVCKQVTLNWSEFDRMTLKNFEKIAKDSIQNEMQIAEKLNEAHTAMKNKQYIKYGQAIAEAMRAATDDKVFLY